MSRQALLLINLGSPASPAVSDVRRYLNQFLMDPHVIDLPWLIRRLLVGLILLIRPRRSAEAYHSIWWPEGSPLVTISQQLATAVQKHWQAGPVVLAMRYGQPSIQKVLTQLAEQDIAQVTVAPLYPQFAASTTTTALVEVERVVSTLQLPLQVSVLPAFFDQPVYLDALAQSLQPYLAEGFDHLLMSYHGLPERHLLRADPSAQHCLKTSDCCQYAKGTVLGSCYRAQCYRVSTALAERTGLKPAQWSVSFQSRLGRTKWIEPYTEARLEELAAQGVRKLLVVCPAFVADCIETLEEIGIRAREQFIVAGGQELVLVPCLNTQPQWVHALSQLCTQATQPLAQALPSGQSK